MPRSDSATPYDSGMSASATTTFTVDGEYLLVAGQEFWAPLAFRVAIPVVESDEEPIRWLQFRMAWVPFANDWLACLAWGNSDLCSNYQVWDLDGFDEHPETVEVRIGEAGPEHFEAQVILPRQSPERTIALLDAIARWERGVVGDLPT